VWLGLSNLHTVLGVNLGDVSFAAIAAALPRLHTLGAFGGNDPAQAEFFMTGLLPRLRVFHFNGAWPKTQERPASTVAPLPLLQELVWNLSDDTTAPPEFLGARPIVLHAPFALISQCWLAAADAPANFLARVRNVRITTMFRLDRLDPADVARVLRAAPQLKKFHIDPHGDDVSWLAPAAPTHPAFEGLAHPRLREFGFPRACAGANTPLDDQWAAQLRRRHFPRLRELVVGKGAYFVTPPDRPLLETGTTV
jgi:hypothetical protein